MAGDRAADPEGLPHPVPALRQKGRRDRPDCLVRACIVFVEVKARAAIDDAALAITPDKIRLMTRRINDWRSRNAWASGQVLRADAVFVGQRRWPSHVENVFPLDMP
jgi:Holliday junction resolvase-like predicted endonuclease